MKKWWVGSPPPAKTKEKTGTHPPLLCFKKNDCAGSDLLSHTPPGAVPSAHTTLATGFGKGPGVTPWHTPPTQTHPHNTHPPQRVHLLVLCQTLHNRHDPLTAILFFLCFYAATQPTHTLSCDGRRYISIGHLTTPYNASNPDLSTPSSLGNLNRNLISQQASRLDAFSGYPSRT